VLQDLKGMQVGDISMCKLVGGLAAVLLWAACVLAYPSDAGAGAGGSYAFHGGGRFHGGFHGFYRGLYPYTLFGYPNYYSYGGYYPYSFYEDDSSDCRFEWPKRSVKHKPARRGVWTCS
jgi:hypothetical protein